MQARVIIKFQEPRTTASPFYDPLSTKHVAYRIVHSLFLSDMQDTNSESMLNVSNVNANDTIKVKNSFVGEIIESSVPRQ